LIDIRAWIRACIDKYTDAAATDVHDQGTFTTAWEPYIKLTGDEDALHFNFELFHGALLRLDPNDDATNAILLDAAEHMGNWSADVEPWFDWEKGLFYSSFFGSDGIRLEPGMALNIPDHMRCIKRASGRMRFWPHKQ